MGEIGILAALYPAVWGLGQLVTGALSDRWGRKHLITAGMLAPGRRPGRASPSATPSPPGPSPSVLLGAGTAMVYPTLLAAIGDVAHPPGGPAPSASTGCGATSDSPSAPSSPASSPTPSGSVTPIWAVAALTAASGLVVARAHVRDPPAPCEQVSRAPHLALDTEPGAWGDDQAATVSMYRCR